MTILDELAAIRTAANAVALPITATVGRYTITDDNIGGRIESWPSSGTLQVRLGQLRSRRPPSDIGERFDIISPDVHVTYPESATLNERDRLTIGAATYEVLDVLDSGSWSIFNEAYAIQIQ